MTQTNFKIAGIAAAVTCLLYSSGLLVIFTPFPLYFVSIVYGRGVRRITIIVTAAAALLFYLLAMPVLVGLIPRWSFIQLVLLLPGVGLAEFFNIGSAQYFGLFYLAYFLLFGYLFSEGMFKEWSLVRWFAVSSCATFGLLILATVLPGMFGVSVLDGMQRYMQNVLSEFVAAQESAGTGVFAIKQSADQIVRFSLSIVPAVVFLLGLMVAAVNQVLARWMIRVPERFRHFGDVTIFSLPHQLVWIVILLGFLFFLERYIYPSDVMEVVALNGIIAFAGIYFLQGLIVVSFYLSRLRGRWLKSAIYISIFLFIQATAPALAIVGFTDLWIDFRRLMGKK